MVIFTSGSDFVWTSPVIPKLHRNDSNLNPLSEPITPLEESLIAGSCILGALIGSIILSKLPDIYGRKNVLIFISSLKFMSYMTLAFSHTVLLYYVTRLILGVGFGMAIALVPIYVAEICEVHNRGKFGAFIGLFLTLGNLYGFVIGSLFSVRVFTILCGAPLLLNLTSLIMFLPETPVYLMMLGKREDAKRALSKFRPSHSVYSQQELDKTDETLSVSTKSSNGEWTSLFKTKWLRKAMAACVGVSMLQQFSGITAIVGFIGPVFDSAGCELSGNTSAIIVGIVQVLSFFLASQLVDRLGRRILLLISSVSTGFVHIALGIYFYLLNVGVNLDNVSWLPVVLLIMFFISYCVGLGPTPLILLSEMFPTEVKSFAAALVSFLSGASALFSIISFPLILNFLGATWCFCLFSIFCLLGAVFIYFFVPETKAKNINDIQKTFNR